MAGKFDGKVIWITGASSGIGASLAKEFAKEGGIIALSARRVDRLNALREEIANAHIYLLDVQNKALNEEVANKIALELGAIDVVVANAGYGVFGNLTDLTEEMWRKQFDTNVFGVVWTLQAAIPHLKKSRGRIAIMSSVAGKMPLGESSAYSASKSALTAIANSLYLELYQSGVSVTNLAPGLVESEFGHVDNLGEFKEKKRDRRFGNLFRWPTEKAAKIMVKAIKDRKRDEVVTGHAKVAAFLSSHLPSLTYWGMAKAQRKID